MPVYTVQDLSSGSLDGTFPVGIECIIGPQHTGRGDKFLAHDPKVVDLRYVYSGKQNLPEAVYSSDMIDIMENEDIVFTKVVSEPVVQASSVSGAVITPIIDKNLRHSHLQRLACS